MIWDEIEDRMDAAHQYEAFSLRRPWCWMPARLRLFAYKLRGG